MIEGVFLLKGPKLDDIYFIINTSLPDANNEYFQGLCAITRSNFPQFSDFIAHLADYGFHVVRNNDFSGSYDWNENRPGV